MPISIASVLFPSLCWKINTAEKVIYITFDDGPVPEVTPWVLNQLNAFKAKGTFFCVGANVELHPDIYKSIIDNGHATGNHTFTHANAWKTNVKEYLEDVEKASQLISSDLFRPPYGKITPALIRKLKTKYKIIMWDVLSKDYDNLLSSEDCIKRVLKRTVPGSIIVFHDSVKAKDRLFDSLPAVLKHFSENGYRFGVING